MATRARSARSLLLGAVPFGALAIPSFQMNQPERGRQSIPRTISAPPTPRPVRRLCARSLIMPATPPAIQMAPTQDETLRWNEDLVGTHGPIAVVQDQRAFHFQPSHLVQRRSERDGTRETALPDLGQIGNHGLVEGSRRRSDAPPIPPSAWRQRPGNSWCACRP
jgi:hypothetical protein